MELPIEKILERYTIDAPEVEIRKRVAEIISDELSIQVDQEAVTYQKGKLFVSVSPLARSQIQIKKDHILKRLEAEISNKKIRDIR